MHYLKRILSLSLFIFSLSGQALNWAPEVSIQLKKISDLNYSKDGNHIAMVVREALIEGEKSEYLNQIWVYNDGSESLTQFTYNDKSSSHPRFSPDGSKLRLFASARTPSPKFRVSIPFDFNTDTIVDLPEPGMPVRQTMSFTNMKLFINASV